MYQHLGICARTKNVTVRFELPPQVEMVVEFPIKDDPHAVIFVRHRLTATLYVDNTEPSMPETD